MKNTPTAERWVRQTIRQQHSYHVPPAGNYIKLDAMENPWPMPPQVNLAWRDALTEVQLNRYPDPRAASLTPRLRSVMSIPDEAAVMLGNGSDELIQVILMALAADDATVLAPTPSFVMYEVLATACGLQFAGVPLLPDFSLDMPAMREKINERQPAVIFLASPNNPTGAAFKSSDVEQVLDLAPGLVVVDEAYQPFTHMDNMGFMSRLTEYPDLIVMRTLSKVGLAGIRLGLIAGHPDWLTELDKLRLPYNINTLTQATASFAIDNWTVFSQQIKEICSERDRVYAILSSLPGIRVWPSETNFILFRVAGDRAESLHAGLLEKGVLIKCLHRSGTALDNCLRVTIGRPDENEAFLTAFTELLAS